MTILTPNHGLKKPSADGLDSADLRVFIGDNMDIIDGKLNKKEAFLVYQTQAQAVATGTWTKISFQSMMFDKATGWDDVNKRYVVKNAGVFLITGAVNWMNTTDGVRTVMDLRKNGSSLVWMTQEHAGAGKNFSSTGVTTAELSAGDYIELWIWHDVGLTMDTLIIGTPANASTFFSATWIM